MTDIGGDVGLPALPIWVCESNIPAKVSPLITASAAASPNLILGELTWVSPVAVIFAFTQLIFVSAVALTIKLVSVFMTVSFPLLIVKTAELIIENVDNIQVSYFADPKFIFLRNFLISKLYTKCH